MHRIRVGVDASPLLGTRSGIGVYVAQLIDELADEPDLDVRAAAFSLRGRAPLRHLPSGVRAVHRPVPARLLHRAWLRGGLPPAEWLMGRVDIVHGTNFVLPPPRRAAGVVSVHDLSFVHYPELVSAASLSYRELVPRAVARAAAVLVDSRAVGREVAEVYGVAEDRIHVTPLGVDPSWADAAAAPPVEGYPSDYLVAVGTIEPRKGLDVLLRAFAATPSAPPLVLAGAAGWGPELEFEGLDRDRVIVTGYLPSAAVQALVANARALVYPSRYEGFGLPPLEALAAGTPVIASDLACVREVVGQHATLVPVGNVDALAASLNSVLDSPPGAERIAAGRAHAAGFTWARTAELTAEVYRAVAA